jgi:hypothetical protein
MNKSHEDSDVKVDIDVSHVQRLIRSSLGPVEINSDAALLIKSAAVWIPTAKIAQHITRWCFSCALLCLVMFSPCYVCAGLLFNKSGGDDAPRKDATRERKIEATAFGCQRFATLHCNNVFFMRRNGLLRCCTCERPEAMGTVRSLAGSASVVLQNQYAGAIRGVSGGEVCSSSSNE